MKININSHYSNGYFLITSIETIFFKDTDRKHYDIFSIAFYFLNIVFKGRLDGEKQ